MNVLLAKHSTEPGSHNGSILVLRVCKRPWALAVLPPRICLSPLILLTILLLGGCAASSREGFPDGYGTLVLNLEGFRSERGTAVVSLFAGPKGFPDQVLASLATVTVDIHEGKATATFAALPYRDYAVSVLHDEDGDGQMATGLFGTPREGFGFSGYPDYRFGHPDYAAVRFLLVEPQREMTIGMRYETGRRQHQDEGRASESRRPHE